MFSYNNGGFAIAQNQNYTVGNWVNTKVSFLCKQPEMIFKGKISKADKDIRLHVLSTILTIFLNYIK